MIALHTGSLRPHRFPLQKASIIIVYSIYLLPTLYRRCCYTAFIAIPKKIPKFMSTENKKKTTVQTVQQKRLTSDSWMQHVRNNAVEVFILHRMITAVYLLSIQSHTSVQLLYTLARFTHWHFITSRTMLWKGLWYRCPYAGSETYHRMSDSVRLHIPAKWNVQPPNGR